MSSGGPFPFRLHDMISFCDAHQGPQSAIGWALGGRGFVIRDVDQLIQVLPLFFGKSKFKTFVRQLNIWDFDRIPSGPNRGTCMHPCFVKGKREQCQQMNRLIKKKRPRAPPGTHRPLQKQQTTAQVTPSSNLEPMGSLNSENNNAVHHRSNQSGMQGSQLSSAARRRTEEERSITRGARTSSSDSGDITTTISPTKTVSSSDLRSSKMQAVFPAEQDTGAMKGRDDGCCGSSVDCSFSKISSIRPLMDADVFLDGDFLTELGLLLPGMRVRFPLWSF